MELPRFVVAEIPVIRMEHGPWQSGFSPLDLDFLDFLELLRLIEAIEAIEAVACLVA